MKNHYKITNQKNDKNNNKNNKNNNKKRVERDA